MVNFESLQNTLFPSEWQTKNLITPYSAGTAQTVKPYHLIREKLPLYLFLYTISGTGRLLYNGKEYELKKGDLFLIDCLEHHEYCAVSNTWEFCFAHINRSMIFEEYYNQLTQNGSAILFRYPPFYKDCFEKLEEISLNINNKSSMKASLCLTNAVLNLALITERDIPDNIKSAAEYINENFIYEISVDKLSQVAGLSKYYFIRSFYKYYGATPYEYLSFCRINHAKSLLLGSNESIEKISAECGFSSVVTFNRCFKNKVGISPSKFKKELKMM